MGLSFREGSLHCSMSEGISSFPGLNNWYPWGFLHSVTSLSFGCFLPGSSSVHVFPFCLWKEIYSIDEGFIWEPGFINLVLFLGIIEYWSVKIMFRYFTVCKTSGIKTDANRSLKRTPMRMATKETWTRNGGRKKPLNLLDLSEFR